MKNFSEGLRGKSVKCCVLAVALFFTGCNGPDQAITPKNDSIPADKTTVKDPADTIDSTNVLYGSPLGKERFWKIKKDAGVVWIGLGNEPFWSVEYNETGNMVFRLAEWKEGIGWKADQVKTAKDSIVYTARNDSSDIKITLRRDVCSDGMSDRVYDRSVKVEFGGQVYNGCGVVL
jgi:hypothetical protein